MPTPQKITGKKMLGWHFIPADGKTKSFPNAAGVMRRRRKVTVGETLSVKGPLVLWEKGLVFSPRVREALSCASGPVVCRVDAGGDILLYPGRFTDHFSGGGGQGTATERKCIAMADAVSTSKTLQEFTYWCALNCLESERKIGREPEPILWEALQFKRDHIDGKVTDEGLALANDYVFRMYGKCEESITTIKRVSCCISVLYEATQTPDEDKDCNWITSASYALACMDRYASYRTALHGKRSDKHYEEQLLILNAELEKRLLALLGLTE